MPIPAELACRHGPSFVTAPRCVSTTACFAPPASHHLELLGLVVVLVGDRRLLLGMQLPDDSRRLGVHTHVERQVRVRLAGGGRACALRAHPAAGAAGEGLADEVQRNDAHLCGQARPPGVCVSLELQHMA